MSKAYEDAWRVTPQDAERAARLEQQARTELQEIIRYLANAGNTAALTPGMSTRAQREDHAAMLKVEIDQARGAVRRLAQTLHIEY